MKAGSAGLNYMVILKPDDFKQAFAPWGQECIERRTRTFANVHGAHETVSTHPTAHLLKKIRDSYVNFQIMKLILISRFLYVNTKNPFHHFCFGEE